MLIYSWKAKLISVALAAGMVLAGCESTGDKETIGTLVGAGLGAALGAHAKGNAKAPTMILGAVLGGYLGNRIGKKLDKADQIKHQETQYQTFEYGRSNETQEWQNPDTQAAGTVTPRPSYQNEKGEYCREFQQTVTVGGEDERGYGTACRQPGGSWKIS